MKPKRKAKLARAVSLRVTNSQIEARIEQMNVQARYLMQDQKKVGPNLKDVRLKLRKEWIPAVAQRPAGLPTGHEDAHLLVSQS
jgi:hypothetical protein